MRLIDADALCADAKAELMKLVESEEPIKPDELLTILTAFDALKSFVKRTETIDPLNLLAECNWWHVNHKGELVGGASDQSHAYISLLDAVVALGGGLDDC